MSTDSRTTPLIDEERAPFARKLAHLIVAQQREAGEPVDVDQIVDQIMALVNQEPDQLRATIAVLNHGAEKLKAILDADDAARAEANTNPTEIQP